MHSNKSLSHSLDLCFIDFFSMFTIKKIKICFVKSTQIIIYKKFLKSAFIQIKPFKKVERRTSSANFSIQGLWLIYITLF